MDPNDPNALIGSMMKYHDSACWGRKPCEIFLSIVSNIMELDEMSILAFAQ